MRNIFSITFLIALSGCQSATSHLPLPHQLPGAAAESAIENSRYKRRRKNVKASIQPHVDFMLKEAKLGGGIIFNSTCEVAKVKPSKCTQLAQQISKDSHVYETGTINERVEKLTVAFMVNGTS